MYFNVVKQLGKDIILINFLVSITRRINEEPSTSFREPNN